MKILKILGIIVLILGLLFVGIIVFGPTEGHLERQITIDAPAKAVYAEVSNLKSFNNWSPWFQKDPNAEYKWEGPANGVGATQYWFSDNKELGNGYMKITEVIESAFVNMDMGFDQNQNRDFSDEGEEKPTASFLLEESDGKTLVTWTFDITGVSGTGKMMVVGLNMFLGPSYEEGLAALKERVESRPEWTASISVEAVDPITFVGDRVTVTNKSEEISHAMGESFGRIMEAIAKNSLEMEGSPLTLYETFDENSITMVCGLPVPAGSLLEGDDMSVMQSHEGMALRALHFGDYRKLKETHEQITQYAEYYNFNYGTPWEVYITDPMQELDTAKWLTEVYYPLK